MKKKLNNDKFFVFKVILFILIFLFLIFCLLNIILFYTYKNVVLPNSLIDKLDISNYSYKKVEKKIDFNKNVILLFNILFIFTGRVVAIFNIIIIIKLIRKNNKIYP